MFRDRADAGRRLAARLGDVPDSAPVVLALPRGGVPVASEIVAAWGCDLDVLVVRKLGAPGNPEFAVGAIGEDGVVVVDDDVRRRLRISPAELECAIVEQRRELDRRALLYRGGRPRVPISGRGVVIVDDGLATGSTAMAAARVARLLGATRVAVAIPVGSAQAVERLRSVAVEVTCLEVPDPFYSVGEHYDDFAQISDTEVLRILEQHNEGRSHTFSP